MYPHSCGYVSTWLAARSSFARARGWKQTRTASCSAHRTATALRPHCDRTATALPPALPPALRIALPPALRRQCFAHCGSQCASLIFVMFGTHMTALSPIVQQWGLCPDIYTHGAVFQPFLDVSQVGFHWPV